MNRRELQGRKLLKLRRDMYKSRRQISELTKVSQSALVKYELGTKLAPTDKLIALCDFYGVTPNEVLGYEEN